MTCNLPIWGRTVDNHVPSILVPSDVRACINKHLILQSSRLNLLFKLFNKNRPANTTPTVTAPMGTYKHMRTRKHLLHSRSPRFTIHKNILNKAIHIRFLQTPSIEKAKKASAPRTQPFPFENSSLKPNQNSFNYKIAKPQPKKLLRKMHIRSCNKLVRNEP